jgi:hypothetical protein
VASRSTVTVFESKTGCLGISFGLARQSIYALELPICIKDSKLLHKLLEFAIYRNVYMQYRIDICAEIFFENHKSLARLPLK